MKILNLNLYSTVTLDKGHAYQWQVISFSDNFPENSPSSDIWRFYLQGDAEQMAPHSL